MGISRRRLTQIIIIFKKYNFCDRDRSGKSIVMMFCY